MNEKFKRDHHCGQLTKQDAGQEVALCGWVATRRDHGGLIFIDLRDRSGVVQVVIDPAAGESFKKSGSRTFRVCVTGFWQGARTFCGND